MARKCQDIFHQMVILFVHFSRIIKLYFEYTPEPLRTECVFQKGPALCSRFCFSSDFNYYSTALDIINHAMVHPFLRIFSIKDRSSRSHRDPRKNSFLIHVQIYFEKYRVRNLRITIISVIEFKVH